jgi:glutaredoxin
MGKLELFYQKSCPFCKKVISFLEEKGIEEVELKEINKDPDARRRLREDGGKIQVPCLFIDGEPLYESDDIIEWLEENIA